MNALRSPRLLVPMEPPPGADDDVAILFHFSHEVRNEEFFADPKL
jgi:hypothetical protein